MCQTIIATEFPSPGPLVPISSSRNCRKAPSPKALYRRHSPSIEETTCLIKPRVYNIRTGNERRRLPMDCAARLRWNLFAACIWNCWSACPRRMAADIFRLSCLQTDTGLPAHFRSGISGKRLRYHGQLPARPYSRHVCTCEIWPFLPSHPGTPRSCPLVVRAARAMDSSGGLLHPGCAPSDRIRSRSLRTHVFKFCTVRIHRRLLLGCCLYYARLCLRGRVESGAAQCARDKTFDDWPRGCGRAGLFHSQLYSPEALRHGGSEQQVKENYFLLE